MPLTIHKILIERKIIEHVEKCWPQNTRHYEVAVANHSGLHFFHDGDCYLKRSKVPNPKFVRDSPYEEVMDLYNEIVS